MPPLSAKIMVVGRAQVKKIAGSGARRSRRQEHARPLASARRSRRSSPAPDARRRHPTLVAGTVRLPIV